MNKIKKYGISLIIGYIMLFVSFVITSLIFAYTNIQDEKLSIAVYICFGISTLISSFILGKKIKEKGLIVGLIYGILFYSIIYIISAVISGFSFSIDTLIYVFISLVFSIVGAILGVNI